ncbi:SDR family NAD(P)-dependent oxidoreductase [Conexibacter sp. CPCC 206217]|uniref:SDR family NAD(P)-dependent oxidoreductase n=1 Tax=Conexibacter sp. CPCC 206217 TaxID=3064574 RepID=UPI002727EE62|nr:SDR family NAD(P)-dependent oxidoreductase [Conexibacter sp. CPCC 206217]MDO8209564.1 SDR family NAD(P)-dependent oxidoreductase [Conexibacter sp. CPCC 206217]
MSTQAARGTRRSLEERVCVVTGAGSGIGRANALGMAARGGWVVVSDVDLDAARETVAQIAAAGGSAEAVRCDVTDGASVQALMETTVELFGGLHVLNANAGVHEADVADVTTIEQMPEETWDRICDVNLKGVFLCMKHAIPHLRAAGGGAIVNAGSTSSFVGYPMAPAYCATKGGVMQLTKVAAIELAPYGIRANCYCPGSIDTPLMAGYLDAADDRAEAEWAAAGSHLVPRLGRPEEIANLVCFLASDEASFVTGAAYLADGGSLAWRGFRERAA